MTAFLSSPFYAGAGVANENDNVYIRILIRILIRIRIQIQMHILIHLEMKPSSDPRIDEPGTGANQ